MSGGTFSFMTGKDRVSRASWVTPVSLSIAETNSRLLTSRPRRPGVGAVLLPQKPRHPRCSPLCHQMEVVGRSFTQGRIGDVDVDELHSVGVPDARRVVVTVDIGLWSRSARSEESHHCHGDGLNLLSLPPGANPIALIFLISIFGPVSVAFSEGNGHTCCSASPLSSNSRFCFVSLE